MVLHQLKEWDESEIVPYKESRIFVYRKSETKSNRVETTTMMDTSELIPPPAVQRDNFNEILKKENMSHS